MEEVVVVGVFILGLDLVFVLLFFCVVWWVCWFCGFFVIVVVNVFCRWVFWFVGIVFEVDRGFGVGFWLSFICICCIGGFDFLFWLDGMFWFVLLVIDLFIVVLCFVKEGCVDICGVIEVVGVDILFFLDLLFFGFNFVIKCDCIGEVLLILVDCLVGFGVMLVVVGVMRFKEVLIIWEEVILFFLIEWDCILLVLFIFLDKVDVDLDDFLLCNFFLFLFLCLGKWLMLLG